MWSVGWHGAVLRWNIAALDGDPTAFAAAAQAAWGLTLDDVLATQP